MTGYTITVSTPAAGDAITLVCSKDDHEAKHDHVIRLTVDQAGVLASDLRDIMEKAKARRRAIKVAAKQAATPDPDGTVDLDDMQRAT